MTRSIAIGIALAVAAGCGRVGFEPGATGDGGGDAGDGGGGGGDAPPDGTTCVPSDLVLHLRFDETSGLTAADSSGTGNTGELVGYGAMGAWAPGVVGGALQLDGAAQYVEVTSPSLDDLTRLTICAWIYPDTFSSAFPIIADKSSDGFLNGWNFYLATGVQSLGFYTNARASQEATSIAAGTWTHVCASWDGTPGHQGIVLYEGAMPVQPGQTGDLGGPFMTDAAQDLRIGRSVDGMNAFAGRLDDLRIYHRVLDGTEIAAVRACSTGM